MDSSEHIGTDFYKKIKIQERVNLDALILVFHYKNSGGTAWYFNIKIISC